MPNNNCKRPLVKTVNEPKTPAYRTLAEIYSNANMYRMVSENTQNLQVVYINICFFLPNVVIICTVDDKMYLVIYVNLAWYFEICEFKD